jgi:hypothetical protein
MSSLDIKSAQIRLYEFNSILKKNNSLFRLKFDKFSKLNNIHNCILNEHADYSNRSDVVFLCLYLEEQCVSSIMCVIHTNHMSISSKTHLLHLGKKYNLLLRSIIVLIGSLIRVDNIKLKSTRSFVINPISEKCLRKYFIIDNVPKEPNDIEIKFNKNKKQATELAHNVIKFLY